MDARPFRPRGAENAIPSLHQRHKSTGTLRAVDTNAKAPLKATENANGGFRGPAKRAAFGDVTNVTRNLGQARDEPKNAKTLTTAAPQPVDVHVAASTENMVHINKEALSRPAQRVPGLSTKPKAPVPVAVLRQTDVASKPTRALMQQPSSYSHEASILEPKLRSTASNDKLAAINRMESIGVPPLQPRHHKSQPQLKQQQQQQQRRPLIDYQERMPELPTVPESHDPLDMPCQVIDPVEHVGFINHASLVDLPSLSEMVGVGVIHGNEAPLPQSHLPSGDNADLAQVIIRDHAGPALSEPEEYWDEEEDDEDYDDQAFTTAHSTRSRDLTTGGVTTLLAPRNNTRVQRELEEAKVDTEKNRSRDDILDELWDVSMVAEYGDDINDYMRDLEIRMLPNPHYMDSQTEIQWSMRSVLMDWLVQVHGRFGLLPETLFLTVNYIDRFLTCKIVSMGKLQLAGATALLIASKYEEINCPSLQDIVYMVDGSYTSEEILKAERYMLSMLSFELGWPGPMSFLRRVSKADDYELETRTLAKYFLELTIMDERFVASPPSYLAAGAHCLSRLILKKGTWTKAHTHWSGYTWAQLKPLVTMLLECCEEPRLHHAAIFEKYSEKRFKEASLIVQECLDAGFTLPHLSAPVRNQLVGHDQTSESLERPQAALVPIEG
jgi:G2/mitotic-specific cyclin 3/4